MTFPPTIRCSWATTDGHCAIPARSIWSFDLGARMPHQDAMIPSGAKVIHVSIDPEQIGRVVPTDRRYRRRRKGGGVRYDHCDRWHRHQGATR